MAKIKRQFNSFNGQNFVEQLKAAVLLAGGNIKSILNEDLEIEIKELWDTLKPNGVQLNFSFTLDDGAMEGGDELPR